MNTALKFPIEADSALTDLAGDLCEGADSGAIVGAATVSVTHSGDILSSCAVGEADEERVADALELLAAQLRGRRRRPPSFFKSKMSHDEVMLFRSGNINATGALPGYFAHYPAIGGEMRVH